MHPPILPCDPAELGRVDSWGKSFKSNGTPSFELPSFANPIDVNCPFPATVCTCETFPSELEKLLPRSETICGEADQKTCALSAQTKLNGNFPKYEFQNPRRIRRLKQ